MGKKSSFLLPSQAMQRIHCFFGTAKGQSDLTLQGLAEEEDLDLEFDDEVLDYWQAYVEKGRCAMRPVWRGLTFRVPTPGPKKMDSNGETITTASLGKGAFDAAEDMDAACPEAACVRVEAILGAGGKPVHAAVVGPATRFEAETFRAAAPAA